MRKCRSAACRSEIPRKKDCSDPVQAGGFCGMDCLMDHTRAKAKRAQIRKEKQKRSETAAAKRAKNHDNKSHQEELTQQVCNKMIRLLDHGLPCISCGRYQCGSFWNAGHFRSVAASPETRFDPRNIHLQGSGCNFGNRRPDMKSKRKAETIAQEYQERLRERHGNDLVDWILGPHDMPHWSCDDLRALRAVFSAECKRLESGLAPSRDWRAMDYSIKSLIE